MRKPLEFSRKYILSIAAAAALILFGGAMLKPERRASIEKISEQERTRLQRLVRKRSVQEIGEFIAEAAGRASPYLLYSELTQTSGVATGPDGRAVFAAHGAPVVGESVILTNGANGKGALVYARPDVPYVAFRVDPSPDPLPDVRSPTALREGEWLVAVWRGSAGFTAFSPGLYSGASSAACMVTSMRTITFGGALPRESAGGGVFDLDGALVAILVPCDGAIVAALPASVLSHVPAESSLEDRLANRFGIALEPGEKSLLVTTVWPGYPASLAGLEKGDLLQGTPDLTAAEPQELSIRRGRRTIRIPWPYQPPAAPDTAEARP